MKSLKMISNYNYHNLLNQEVVEKTPINFSNLNNKINL